MIKLTIGQKLKNLFKTSITGYAFFDDLADILVENDVGPKTSFEMITRLKDFCKTNQITTQDDIQNELKRIIRSLLKKEQMILPQGQLSFLIVLGVNGVGKTTSIAKLGFFLKREYPENKIIFAAGDTFRAAAIEQLRHHGEKLGIRVIAHEQGSDPGAVVYDTITAAKSSDAKIIIADTAGRLHNKINLVKELEKIIKIASSRIPQENIIKLLVIDATTGQNGFVQAQTFNEAIHIDGIILTKYDSTAKGGIIIAIQQELQIPVFFLGSGEKYEDFNLFDPDLFLGDFLDPKDFLDLNET